MNIQCGDRVSFHGKEGVVLHLYRDRGCGVIEFEDGLHTVILSDLDGCRSSDKEDEDD